MTPSEQSRRRTRANGEGGVWHDKARGRWVGTVTVGYTDATDEDGAPIVLSDGTTKQRQIRRTVTAKTKAEAVTKLRRMQTATDNGQSPARETLTVGRFLDQWAADVLPGTVAPRTEQQYRDTIRLYLKPAIGQKRLRTLEARDVSAMLRNLTTKGVPPNDRPLSPNTCRIVRAVLRRALRHAEMEGLVARNVAALAQGVKLTRPAGRSLSPDQARQLLAHLKDDRLEAAYTVALALGLRAGELLALAWPDLELDGNPPRLTVNHGVTRVRGHGLVRADTKTHGSRRTLHLPPQVVAALRTHRATQSAERLLVGPAWPALPLGANLVFRTELGTPLDPDNFRHHVYRTTEAAGIGRWTPHELRHSAASLLIAQGIPIEVVSDLLGHSSIKVTADVYGHIFAKSKANAAAAMGAALWGPKE